MSRRFEIGSPQRVSKTWRVLCGFIEAAWRNLVIQIAGSNRQKLCRPNRNVNLCDGTFTSP